MRQHVGVRLCARCWYPRRVVRPGRAILLAIPLVFALCAQQAAADDVPRPEVTRLLREGVALRAEGRDLEALAAFEHAHALQPLGRVQAQRALAEQALGRLDAAAQHLVEALASTDPWVARNRADLDRALATIRAQPPASTPTVPAVPANTAAPADTTAPADTAPRDAATQIAPTHHDAALNDATQRDRAVPSEATPNDATSRDALRDTVRDDASSLEAPAPRADAHTARPNTALLWSGTAATVLGAAGAIVAAALATSTTADYDARYAARGCATGADKGCDADYADTTRRLDVLGAVFHGALGLAAVGGALTLGAFVLTPTVDAAHAGLQLRGTF